VWSSFPKIGAPTNPYAIVSDLSGFASSRARLVLVHETPNRNANHCQPNKLCEFGFHFTTEIDIIDAAQFQVQISFWFLQSLKRVSPT